MGTFFTADNHFCHENIIKYAKRPFMSVEEMNTILISRWNSVVKPKDSIYILGDLIFSNGDIANELIKKLNGKKYLIVGNHDTFLRYDSFDKSLFEWIKDYHVLKYNKLKFILFHFPIHSWDCKFHNSIHLYGHVHNNSMPELSGNAYNVGVDNNDFKPISINKVIDMFTNKII